MGKALFSPSQATRRRFSDLNSLTVSAVENTQDNNLKERGEGPEEKYQPPEEKSWTESSMGEGVLPDNLDLVSLEDIQRRKELETENQEVAVDADQEKMSAEEGTQTFGEIPKEETIKFREIPKEEAENFDEITKEDAKKFAEPDQDLFLGNYQQEPAQSGEFLAAMAADKPTFNLKSADHRPLTADISHKSLLSSGVQGSQVTTSLHLLL